jgi:molybdopterin-guanine dinucleotide biosynthesis protein A
MTQKGTLAVALMAGGKSMRMGCDKARLTGKDGRELWQERLGLLQQTGAEEVMISCREDQDYLTPSGVRLVFDLWPGAGPLGGIVSCLEGMQADHLLVMAVDLPAMTGEGLAALAAAAGIDAGSWSPAFRRLQLKGLGARAPDPPEGGTPKGVVFRCRGLLEPLAGVYPKAMATSGRRRLEAGDLALHNWIAEGEAAGLMQVLEAPDEWSGLFVNVNDPAAWEKWVDSGVA